MIKPRRGKFLTLSAIISQHSYAKGTAVHGANILFPTDIRCWHSCHNIFLQATSSKPIEPYAHEFRPGSLLDGLAEHGKLQKPL